MTGERVRLAGLSKSYAGELVVKDVELDVAPGSFFTLLGPSGSGKSTTLMMIAGFAAPTSGTIRVGETNITDWLPQKRNMGVVFQNYALFPHMTVAENIAYPLRMRRMAGEAVRRRVAETIELVKLGGLEHRAPRQLSGGQQQRVALARALAFNPRVLLMDEPLSALDKSLRSHMQFELKRLQQDLGVTVIYVTHDQEEALSMSDQLAVMNHGLVVQAGKPAELYDRPVNKFVAGFLGDSNFLPGRLERSVDGDESQVDCGFLRVWVEPNSISSGRRVTTAFRPEKVLVNSTPLDGFNSCPVTVARSTFTGDTTRYVLHTEGGATIVAKAQNGPAYGGHPTGAHVYACWRPSDTNVHPEE